MAKATVLVVDDEAFFRRVFSDILAEGMPFYNCTLGKKGCSRVIDDTYARLGRAQTIELLDNMKESNATVVDELVPSVMNVGDVHRVL